MLSFDRFLKARVDAERERGIKREREKEGGRERESKVVIGKSSQHDLALKTRTGSVIMCLLVTFTRLVLCLFYFVKEGVLGYCHTLQRLEVGLRHSHLHIIGN